MIPWGRFAGFTMIYAYLYFLFFKRIMKTILFLKLSFFLFVRNVSAEVCRLGFVR